jgi:type I restriction enzyme S subunit
MSNVLKKPNVPKLRFPEFEGDWQPATIRQLLQRVAELVDVKPDEQYRQIGIRSHGKGLFHKEAVFGSELGEKRVFWVRPNALVINIVFAWEQALALTTDNEKGMIASHRFPMFLPIKGKSDLNFVFRFFMRKQGKELLALASPGGAGRNRTLGQSEFMKLKVILPGTEEQKKIATFLSAVDAKLEILRRKRAALERYKKGLMQQLFSQKSRFALNNGTEFPAWKERILGDVLTEHKLKSTGNENVFSVTVRKGLVNQIEHLGRSFSANNTAHYNLVRPHDVVYTKSPTGEFPFGIIKQSRLFHDAIVSPLYGVFTPETPALGYIMHNYFESPNNAKNYLISIVQKGAKNTISVTNSGFLSKTLTLPVSQAEQTKIADALSAMDKKLWAVTGQIVKMEAFKKGLLQQLFA